MMQMPMASMIGITNTPLPIMDSNDDTFYSVESLVLPHHRLEQVSDNEGFSDTKINEIEPDIDPRLSILLDADVWKKVSDALTPWQCLIFEMYYVREFTQKEIAESLKIKAGHSSVCHTLEDCRKRLKNKLTMLGGLI